jgi:hypothetical protein
MYETLEHYKVYKQKQDELQQAKQLFEECGFQRKAKAKQEVAPIIKQIFRKLVTDYDKVSFDEWMKDLVDKNGVTKY